MTNLFQSTRERVLWWLVFSFGALLSIFMALRSQIGGDQRLLLDLGWSIVGHGEWLPYGMPTSAGGRSPGGLMGLLVALPLWLWRDYRAPAVFTVILHTGAFLLLALNLKSILSRSGMWLLLLLVWLGPWRMYFSAHLWNANLMFVVVALHFASSLRMSTHREAWNSCLQVLLIALAMQVHTSAAVLAVLSLLLLWKRMIKVHWGGFVVGVILAIFAYVPWLLAISNDANLAPGNKGFFLRGLVYVFPLVRGLLYWLKMPTLAVAARMEEFDFTDIIGTNANALLLPVAATLMMLTQLTMLPSVWANWRFVRRLWPMTVTLKPYAKADARGWLEGYMALSLAAAVFCFAISPTTVMFWQVFVSLPAASLVLIMATERLLRSKLKNKTHVAIKIWSVLTVVVLLLQSVGTPLYRCGGRDAGGTDEMMQALHVRMECRATHE